MDKHEVKISAVYWMDENRESFTDIEDHEQLVIKILDGDQVLAETNLKHLVQKFLVISAEYAKMLAMIEAANKTGPAATEQAGKIIIPGQN